jgi:hypothetical protein
MPYERVRVDDVLGRLPLVLATRVAKKGAEDFQMLLQPLGDNRISHLLLDVHLIHLSRISAVAVNLANRAAYQISAGCRQSMSSVTILARSA